jgi:predicted cobalt transporter CbtA
MCIEERSNKISGKRIALFALAVLFPMVTFAFERMHSLIDNIVQFIINPIIGVIFALGFALFLFGVGRYIMYSGNDTERDTGRQHIMWGLVGMFIMVAVAGIINLIRGTIGV